MKSKAAAARSPRAASLLRSAAGCRRCQMGPSAHPPASAHPAPSARCGPYPAGPAGTRPHGHMRILHMPSPTCGTRLPTQLPPPEGPLSQVYCPHSCPSPAAGGDMRILLASSPTFDPSVGDTFFALAAGATLCIAPRARCLTGGRLWLSPRAFQPRCPPPPSTLRPARSFPPLGQARPRDPYGFSSYPRASPPFFHASLTPLSASRPWVHYAARSMRRRALDASRVLADKPATSPRRESDKPQTRIRQAPDANPPRAPAAPRLGPVDPRG